MNLIKPKKIKKGDTIAIISPSGPISEEKLINGVHYFESMGYKVKIGENALKCDRYLAGNDMQRLNDLIWAFSNPEIKAIICSRGGYGSIRLINKIDYNLIKNNPKIFCGYSDITALSLMFLKKTGLITFSSPMIKGDFQSEASEFTKNNFWGALSVDNFIIKPKKLVEYRNGDAKGILWGGNLSTISSLCGLDFIPDVKFIFFAEDLNEPVYKIDKSFRQLLNIEKFRNNVAGIILGDFLNCESDEDLKLLFYEFANELNIPVYGNYAISHSEDKITLPVGSNAVLNKGEIFISY